MTTTKTILGDQWVVNCCVSANFHLAVYDDAGVELMRSTPHTICITPDMIPEDVLSLVNSDITTRAGLCWPPIVQSDIDRISSHCSIEHTPEVQAAFATFKEQQEQQMKSLWNITKEDT